MNLPRIILIGIVAALALPPAMREKSWCRLLTGMILSFAGVVAPLFIFLGSYFLVPISKDSCTHGWLDCFIVGKLALTPLALLATAALYALEILRVKNRTTPWIVVGIFTGATVAVVCFVLGLVCDLHDQDALWLLVPFYVAVWYSVRAVQLIKAARLGIWTYIRALAGSLPFWVASWLWSVSTYKSLPDHDPGDCFVVTAASRGHENFVGPFTEITRHGRKRRANQQLIVFWQLEAWWSLRSPRNHCRFRRFYNRVGPAIARHITSPWLADTVCALLKPLEWTAKLVLKITTLPKQP